MNLIWIAVELDVAAELAAPVVIEFLIEQESLMKQIRVASRGSDDRAGLGQRAAGGNNGDVGIAKNILAGAQLDAGCFEAISLKSNYVLLVESIEPNIIIEKKSRVVGKDFLYSAGLNLGGLVRMVINPGFVDCENVTRGNFAEILIIG